MNNLKQWIMIAVALLVIGGAGSLITFFTMKQYDIEETATVDAANISGLEIRFHNGKILMQETDEDDIRVELTGKKRDKSNVHLRVEEVGGTLTIESSRAKSTIFNTFPGVRKLSLTVYIPKKVFDSVQVDIENGSLQARQFHAKNVKTTANNAAITLENVDAETVNVKSNNRNIILDHVTGELIGEARNGTIVLITESLDRNIDFYTNNGSIKIETDKEPTNAILDARANNGKVHVFGKQDWIPAFGNGEHLIKLRANNRNITIEKSVTD